MYNFTTEIYICINYRAVSVLTSAIRQQSFLQHRPKCKLFNTDNLKVYILQIITSRKNKTLQLHIQGCPIFLFHIYSVKTSRKWICTKSLPCVLKHRVVRGYLMTYRKRKISALIPLQRRLRLGVAHSRY